MSFHIKLLLLVSIVISVISCRNSSRIVTQDISAGTDTLPVEKHNTADFMYGIPPDSFNLVSGQIKRNGLLSTILLDHGVTLEEIDRLVKNSAAIFDVRKIRSGNHYTLFCDRDSAQRAEYLVYEHDPTTSYVFSFNDSLNITRCNKEVEKVIRYATGTIETSLWDAMKTGGLHPSLAAGLSEIYAWTVDFFGLQKGDAFKVIYEESMIDGQSIGIGKIFGAQFSGSGTTIDAIPFIQDGKESFYDDDGNSLRKAFLKAPLQFSRVSSRFSSSRMHPILRIRRPHFGVDYAAPAGTPVQAIGDGRVTMAGFENGSGRIVKITHNSVYSTAYLHLSRFGQGIRPGAFVKQGDIIGFVGTSGLSTGPHLDFRFYRNGSPVDPLRVEAPPVEPVSEANRTSFEKSKTVVRSLLNTF